jgi:murein DD-endopeptidase MepM/ murein hydrolase activator NlpD
MTRPGNKAFFTYALVLASLLLIMVLARMMLSTPREQAEAVMEEPEEVLPLLDVFGFPAGEFIVESDVVRPRQTLSHILGGFGLGPARIDAVARGMEEVFSPRRIRQGQAYHGYLHAAGDIRYFVYEISPLEYLVIDLDDSLQVSRREKEVTRVMREASGVIHSSLWNVLSEQGLPATLAIRLSEVLAWEVDFSRIQRGDRFKVVYGENLVGDEAIGVAGIEAVWFVHRDREILGFRFEQDTIRGFFNPAGDNLRKVFLKMPLAFGRISSRFSHSRLHPVLKQRRPHYGTDYAAPHGTPILSVGDGVVTQATYSGGNGNYVRIRHNAVYETQYLHMSRFANGIRPGSRVEQGQVIGYVGSTGLATGPHVCFRFWKNGQQVDHLREEFPSADPLPEAYHESFFALRDSLMVLLDRIPLTD